MKNGVFLANKIIKPIKKSSEENIILPGGTEDASKQHNAERAREATFFKYIIFFGLNKRRLKYLDSNTVLSHGFSPSPSYCINHIFNYLREHPELLGNKDYKRIYKETRNYLVFYAVHECGWNKWETRKNRKDIEFLADLWNKYSSNSSKKYTKEQVDEFLEYRKIVWK